MGSDPTSAAREIGKALNVAPDVLDRFSNLFASGDFPHTLDLPAQMATLPRLQPKCFYDVVIEVAIIRPGPIQGRLMHPYLARRAGRQPVTYYDDRLKPVLERTLGVPLFQEQMLKIAMVMADFSGRKPKNSGAR